MRSPATVIFLFFLIICSSTFSQQKIREDNVPPEIMEDFSHRFPAASNVAWFKQGDELYGVRFLQENENSEAIYSADGPWIQTVEDIQYREMPDSAKKYCSSNYPDYTAANISKLSTRKYGILYEILIRGTQKQVGMTFDMNGKLIESKEEDLPEENEKSNSADLKGKLNKLIKKN